MIVRIAQRCGLYGLAWLAWALMLVLVAFAALATSAQAATAPSFTMAGRIVPENSGPVLLTVLKSNKVNSYSRVRVYTVPGGTCAASRYVPLDIVLQFGNTVLKQTTNLNLVNNSLVDGNCTIRVQLQALRFAIVPLTPASVQVRDDDVVVVPPPPPPPVLCPDGTTVPAGQTCPVVVPPPTSTTQWVNARLLPPNYGRVVSLTNCPLLVGVMSECGQKYPYGQYRTPEVGEVVALYTNGWGWAAGGGPIWTVYSLTHGDTLIVYGADMQGLAPAPGTPDPPLPDGWFAGVLKTATKTCGSLYGPDYGGGVTAGVAYRLWFPASGGYMLPPNPDAFASAVPAADPHFGTFVGVAVGCFM